MNRLINGVFATHKTNDKIFVHPHDVYVDSDENL